MERELPQEGEIWRHFKGGYYMIICVGHHSETKEKMVVYAPYGVLEEEQFYAGCKYTAKTTGYLGEACIRPLEMFMSETDALKYPEVSQQYRFEKSDMTDEDFIVGNYH